MRRPTGGDPNRKALNLHHGICITDDFMQAVETDGKWDLLSPKDKHVVETIKARDLWAKILTTRSETGEPYIIFIDTVNKAIPEHQQAGGAQGENVEPLQRDHAADRPRPPGRQPHGGLLPELAQP